MTILTGLIFAAAVQAIASAELTEVTSTQRLALAALIDCVNEKAKALDDGHESATTIVEASFTSCKDVRDKAVFLTSWKRRLESKDSVKEATDFALTFQAVFDNKVTDNAILALLENRARNNAANK